MGSRAFLFWEKPGYAGNKSFKQILHYAKVWPADILFCSHFFTPYPSLFSNFRK
jgi:hypothetical protein